jgi:hypothetical protein
MDINVLLEMASKGVYRSQLVEACYLAGLSNKEARAAIREAKESGMYIVSILSYQGDTYYQYDSTSL